MTSVQQQMSQLSRKYLICASISLVLTGWITHATEGEHKFQLSYKYGKLVYFLTKLMSGRKGRHAVAAAYFTYLHTQAMSGRHFTTFILNLVTLRLNIIYATEMNISQDFTNLKRIGLDVLIMDVKYYFTYFLSYP